MNLAIEFDLAMTGSSDYHGNGKLNGLGEYTTKNEQWEKLESKANGKLAAATKAEKKGLKSPFRQQGERLREQAMNIVIKGMKND